MSAKNCKLHNLLQYNYHERMTNASLLPSALHTCHNIMLKNMNSRICRDVYITVVIELLRIAIRRRWHTHIYII